MTSDVSPGARESNPRDWNELALTLTGFDVAGDLSLQINTSATASLSPLFTRINFPREVISAEPPTNH